MAKKHGHYCKVCGEYKSNESFSGSGHASHICKKCAALPAAQRSEEMVLTKLWNLPWQLSAQQRDWLKGLQNDSRPEVASTAKELYADRFPYAARNARKKQLHIPTWNFPYAVRSLTNMAMFAAKISSLPLTRRNTR